MKWIYLACVIVWTLNVGVDLHGHSWIWLGVDVVIAGFFSWGLMEPSS